MFPMALLVIIGTFCWALTTGTGEERKEKVMKKLSCIYAEYTLPLICCCVAWVFLWTFTLPEFLFMMFLWMAVEGMLCFGSAFLMRKSRSKDDKSN